MYVPDLGTGDEMDSAVGPPNGLVMLGLPVWYSSGIVMVVVVSVIIMVVDIMLGRVYLSLGLVCDITCESYEAL